MPYEFVLPDLGEGIVEGEIRTWLVKEGDNVEEHQAVLEVETDKAVVEVPSPRKGKVLKIRIQEGEIAKVGETLLTIIEEGEATEEKPKAEEKAEERPKSVTVIGVLPEAGEEVLATPAVRALAKEADVDLKTVEGTGPGGSVTKEDVLKVSKKATAEAPPDQYGKTERVPIRGIRRTIAKNLMHSQRRTAFVTAMEEADVTELWSVREREKESLRERGVHLTFLPFFLKAAQHALREHQLLNASVDEEKEEIVVKKYYNIGIAVDTPDGLMVPVVQNVDKKSILELAEEMQNLSKKARERKIKLEEMRGSSFSITNYGAFGGGFATPIIDYPDVAILGTGKISEKPWVVNGKIVVRKILPLSLTFDHRVTDGVEATRFLSKVVRYLEDPGLLFIEST
jgi:pyruvate dehydrogenase E2 component (dihydrolipoamide acetyltransferase)